MLTVVTVSNQPQQKETTMDDRNRVCEPAMDARIENAKTLAKSLVNRGKVLLNQNAIDRSDMEVTDWLLDCESLKLQLNSLFGDGPWLQINGRPLNGNDRDFACRIAVLEHVRKDLEDEHVMAAIRKKGSGEADVVAQLAAVVHGTVYLIAGVFGDVIAKKLRECCEDVERGSTGRDVKRYVETMSSEGFSALKASLVRELIESLAEFAEADRDLDSKNASSMFKKLAGSLAGGETENPSPRARRRRDT